MTSIIHMKPSIRVSHYYEFPADPTNSEVGRRGYCYAFHLVERGKGAAVVGDRKYPIRKSSLLCIPPGVPHSFLKLAGERLASYNIYCELWEERPRRTRVHLARRAEPYDAAFRTRTVPCADFDAWPFHLALEHQPFLTELFRRIVESNARGDETSAAAANRLLFGWIVEVNRLVHAPYPYDPRVQKMLSRLQSEPDLSAAELLRQSGLRKSQGHSLFKRQTGMSPNAYAVSLRMKRAAAELLETERSVSDIADALGYASLHYFSKQFKQHYGVSPSAYRGRSQPFRS